MTYSRDSSSNRPKRMHPPRLAMTWIGAARIITPSMRRNQIAAGACRLAYATDSTRLHVHVVSLTVHLALPGLDRRRLEPGRCRDLQHLEIVGVLDLCMDDAGRLVVADAVLQPDVADPLVVEHHPALQHVDDLE